MPTPIRTLVPVFCLHRVAAAFRLLHTRGLLLDGPAQAIRRGPAGTAHALPSGATEESLMVLFVARLRELLGATDEGDRQRLESELLALAVPLQAAGLFDLLHIAHPAVAAMVADHLAEPAAG